MIFIPQISTDKSHEVRPHDRPTYDLQHRLHFTDRRSVYASRTNEGPKTLLQEPRHIIYMCIIITIIIIV